MADYVAGNSSGNGSGSTDVNAGEVSTLNRTTTPLGSGETFTGAAETSAHPDMMVTLKCDSDCTLYVDLSTDGGLNYDTQIPFTVTSSVGEFHTIVKGTRACRVRVVNGSTAQTYLRLHTEFGTFRQANKGLQAPAYRDDDASIVRPVDWYQSVQEGRWPNYAMETKFGTNLDIDSGPEDIWLNGGIYTGQPDSFTPETVDVFSSSANDTSAGTGARTVRIFGLKTSTSEAYESEDITLNGAAQVTSSNTWWRINRMYVLTAGSGGENAGALTCRSTTTTANVFAVVSAGYNQTQIAAWTVPAMHTAWLKRVRISMGRANGAAGSALVTIRSRELGGVYRSIRVFTITDSMSADYTALGGSSMAAGSDIKVRCESVSDTNTEIEAALEFLIVED